MRINEMLVFVTGASGYIGTVVCKELSAHGYKILGLARSDESAQKLLDQGYQVIRGDLTDFEALKKGAEKADATIHLAYDHATAIKDYSKSGEIDLKALKALTKSQKIPKPLIMTSGTAMLPNRKPYAIETDAGKLEGFPAVRLIPEQYALSLSSLSSLNDGQTRLYTAAIRIPLVVHSSHDQGFILRLHHVARQKRISAYVGQGTNLWPTVHLDSLGELYRKTLEKVTETPGIRVHAVSESGIEFKEIAKAIGEVLGVPVKSIREDEAIGHFGSLGAVVGIDNPTSSEITRSTLGWESRGPSLLDDIRAGYYLDKELRTVV